MNNQELNAHDPFGQKYDYGYGDDNDADDVDNDTRFHHLGNRHIA